MNRVAALDCGTNSLRLLIADVDAAGVRPLVRQMEVVRLGEGVQRTGLMSDDALARAEVAAARYAALCNDADVSAMRCVATAATRVARNADCFIEVMARHFAPWSLRPEVISGETEAALSFLGATSAVATSASGPYLVVDLGGGSTELVRGTTQVSEAISVSLGCVTVGEELAVTDGIGAALWETIAERTRLALAAAPVHDIATIIGVAGTATTVACQALDLPEYDSIRIDGAAISVTQTLAACRELATMSVAERRALGFMHPGRADVIGVGAVMWATILEEVQRRNPKVQLVISERDILDGAVLSVAGQHAGGLTGAAFTA